MKRAGVSLIECMVCCVALSIALALCVKLMLVGMKWHAYTEDMADMYRHSAVLQDAWRESVGAKALSAWPVENGGLSAGSLQNAESEDPAAGFGRMVEWIHQDQDIRCKRQGVIFHAALTVFLAGPLTYVAVIFYLFMIGILESLM